MSRKKREGKAVPIEISKVLELKIERFLSSREARERGLDDVPDVVTTAIRKLLEEYGYYEEKK